MGQDRYARLKAKNERIPTPDEVFVILKDYIDDAGAVEVDKQDSSIWFVTLKGKPSFPFKSIYPNMGHQMHEERWVEVYLEEYRKRLHIRVTTRMADEYTNNVADGIVKMFARFYQAKLDMGG